MKQLNLKFILVALSMLLAPSALMALEKEGEDYLIKTADDLIEFARLVNNGEAFNIFGNAHAKLMADIDLRGRESEFPLIGSVQHPYQGTFDGQLHTITYDLVSTGESCGLFAYLNGTVRNLCLDGTMQVKHDYAGSIAGTANFPALIERCHSKVKITADGGDYIGGFVGLSTDFNNPPYVRIENCIYSGHIMGSSLHRSGILGWSGRLYASNTHINHCLVTAQIDNDMTHGAGHIIAGGDGLLVEYCYYVYPYGNGEPNGATQITMEQVESGEACCLLNVYRGIYNSVEYQTVFRQNVGEDKMPIFDPLHGLVKEITSMGYASFAPGYFGNDINCNNVTVPKGVKAYTGTLSGSSLLLHPAGDVIGGGNGNGFVLKGEPGFYSFMPTYEVRTAIDNELRGGNAATSTRYCTVYVLDEKDGVTGFYKVSGWDNSVDSHIALLLDPATDADMLTLSIMYTLKYTVDGETYKAYEMEHGTIITPEDAPIKEGYTFSGWSEIPTTMPDNDVTITGHFILDASGITLIHDGKVEETICTPDGRRISQLQQGVNIIRMNDGSTKKVLVK